jgi:hypothetical protein
MFVARLKNAISHDFAAWAFYQRSDWPVNPQGKVFPGILLLGRIAA